MPQPPSDLVSAIQNVAPNDLLLQQSLLYGAYGESGWTDSSAGYFGFTDPSYGNAAQEPALQQVQAILPGYQRTRASLPPGVTGAAAAEYIALGGEAPAFSTPATIKEYGISTVSPTRESEYADGTWYWDNPAIFGISQQEVIAQTNQPTQYGANTSLNQSTTPGVWSDIVAAVGGKTGRKTTTDPPVVTGNPPEGQLPGGKIGPPAAGFPGSPELPYGPPAAGFPGSPGYTGITTANPPNSYPGMSSQISASLDQQMNPVVHGTGTDAQGNTQPSAGILQDAEGFLTGGIIGSDKYAPLHMIFGVNLKGSAESVLEQPVNNAWNAVKAGLVRFGIGLAGLMVMAAGLWIIVSKIGGGATPVPVPVPV